MCWILPDVSALDVWTRGTLFIMLGSSGLDSAGVSEVMFDYFSGKPCLWRRL